MNLVKPQNPAEAAGPVSSGKAEAAKHIVAGMARRRRRRSVALAVFSVLIIAGFVISLMFGHSFYPFSDVLKVIMGEDVPQASFTVGVLRLPRASLAVLAGFSFGLAGVAFQTMLRNPLASPDIIGISAGAAAAAVFGIVFLSLKAATVSMFAIAAGLLVALIVYLLSYRGGVAGTRLILIGIGVAAMLDSFTAYCLSQAAEWNLQDAMRWMTGSLNGAQWGETVMVLVALVLFGSLLLGQSRNLLITQLGDDAASALGVQVGRTRLIVTLTAVGLISFATAATGPVAFVAFLSGPIAARVVGSGRSLLLPSAFTGALLVLVADFFGQFILGTRYPVGVITGVLGAPFLLYLIIKANRVGGSL
jgi:iron complex transport system permease protein